LCDEVLTTLAAHRGCAKRGIQVAFYRISKEKWLQVFEKKLLRYTFCFEMEHIEPRWRQATILLRSSHFMLVASADKKPSNQAGYTQVLPPSPKGYGEAGARKLGHVTLKPWRKRIRSFRSPDRELLTRNRSFSPSLASAVRLSSG